MKSVSRSVVPQLLGGTFFLGLVALVITAVAVTKDSNAQGVAFALVLVAVVVVVLAFVPPRNPLLRDILAIVVVIVLLAFTGFATYRILGGRRAGDAETDGRQPNAVVPPPPPAAPEANDPVAVGGRVLYQSDSSLAAGLLVFATGSSSVNTDSVGRFLLSVPKPRAPAEEVVLTLAPPDTTFVQRRAKVGLANLVYVPGRRTILSPEPATQPAKSPAQEPPEPRSPADRAARPPRLLASGYIRIWGSERIAAEPVTIRTQAGGKAIEIPAPTDVVTLRLPPGIYEVALERCNWRREIMVLPRDTAGNGIMLPGRCG